MRGAALPSSGLYPLAVITTCVLTYAGASALHTSGFAAVYVAALILGNSELPHRGATRSFIEGLGWLSQIGLFVMLGLLLSPARIDTTQILQAVVAGFLLTVVARPLSVWASTLWDRTSWPDRAFMSWAGLRGAVPIVLATIPLSEGVDGAERLFQIVFVLVVIDTLLTGPTLPWVARRLGVTVAGTVRDIEIEAAPLERMAADLLEIRITKRSKMSGVEVGELRLPQGASVSLIVRDGEIKVPDAAHRAAQGRRRPRGHAPQAARGHRGPVAGGLPAGPPGPLARLSREPQVASAARAGGAGGDARGALTSPT